MRRSDQGLIQIFQNILLKPLRWRVDLLLHILNALIYNGPPGTVRDLLSQHS